MKREFEILIFLRKVVIKMKASLKQRISEANNSDSCTATAHIYFSLYVHLFLIILSDNHMVLLLYNSLLKLQIYLFSMYIKIYYL